MITFDKNVAKKIGSQMMFYFLFRIISASALPGETEIL